MLLHCWLNDKKDKKSLHQLPVKAVIVGTDGQSESESIGLFLTQLGLTSTRKVRPFYVLMKQEMTGWQ